MKRKKLHDELTKVSESVSPDSVAAMFISTEGNLVEISQGTMVDTLSEASKKYSQMRLKNVFTKRLFVLESLQVKENN